VNKLSQTTSARAIYRKGAELAVEVALSAPKLVPECRMPRSLQKFVRKDL
jgi:hypothetical protein